MSRLPRSPSLSVLLVGSCEPQQRLTCAMLSQWEIATKVARDGVEAVQLASEQDFDVILIDVDTSVLDSLFVTERIRRSERAHPARRPVPVMAYTAMDRPPCEALVRRSGMNDVLKKSTDGVAMSECLQRWCASHFDGSPLWSRHAKAHSRPGGDSPDSRG
ncbi:response regulator [Methylibium sp.]|uniref:response regulator n=1 Tax=Methylibium sp. TaxID=2067992 RepID=UPI003D134746